MSRFPNFIVIGAMKCMTSTLHEQLANQPGVFMSEPKEPNFFSDDSQYKKGVDWYRSLFSRAMPGDICGESSTHYTKLPTYPATVDRLSKHCGSAKLIYVMRHPIRRLVSQYVHEWTQRVINVPIDQAVECHPELVEYSRYAYQIKPFISAFGSQQILPVFQERLSAFPQVEFERICQFIGCQGTPRWCDELEPFNRGAERMRKSSIRDAILDNNVSRWVRHRFVPQSLRSRISDLWKMKQPPQLGPKATAAIEAICDADLQVLGGMLGVKLCCENFSDVVSKSSFMLDSRERAGVSS